VLDAMTEQMRRLEKSIEVLAGMKYPEAGFLSQMAESWAIMPPGHSTA
jgi:hypothetical protein